MQKQCFYIQYCKAFLICFIFVLLFLQNTKVIAQNCPTNIDFESGNFEQWTCLTGSVSQGGGVNTIFLNPSGGPIGDRHTIFPSGTGQLDPFGSFPVTCPNGSGYSIKLGNNRGGAEAEGVSYEFTIPANRNTYSLTYHYAVVFQDPNHQEYQQPRLEIEAINVNDNELLNCASFTFFPNGSSLPGFIKSPLQQDTTDVWYKNWSAVTMNLNGKAGKKIRLTFKTSDCVFRKHFGYAYIDVNTECESEFVGATYCNDDTAVTVTAPYGYAGYQWMNSNFTQILGTSNTLTLIPPPPSGTLIALQVTPYFGYGCVDTFYAKLIDTLTLIPNAGLDVTYCNGTPVKIGSNPKQGVIYSWNPTEGLDDPTIANPKASPTTTTNYILTVKSLGGGCVASDTVLVESFTVDTSLMLIGKDLFCVSNNDSAILVVPPNGNIQWYKDNVVIANANAPKYKVLTSGNYYASITTEKGCSATTTTKKITIDIPEPATRYPTIVAVRTIAMPLEARNIGATVLWKPSVFLNNANLYQPTFLGTKDTSYTITLTTLSKCVTVDTQAVRVFEYQEIYVPSAFTPNNDGVNDYVFPIGSGFRKINYFKIYNRYGQKVYEWNKASQGWNGSYKGVLQTSQTFVWQAEGIGADNKVYHKKGTIVLIR